MHEPARRLANYEDLLAVPEHLVAEIINGHWLLLATLEGEDEVCQPPFGAVTFDLGVLWP